MIVLTRRKAACSAYCLTMAQHCPYQGNNLPLPGTKQYVGSFFIKHHSSFYSSLFTKSAETPINTGVARGEELCFTLHHSSPLFTTLHLRIAHGIETEARPVRSGLKPLFLCPTDFHRFSGKWLRKRLRVYTIVDISFIRTFAPSF